MDPSKLKRLGGLDEDGLRSEVLVPLLARLGFKAVTVYHGPGERGKDIIAFSETSLAEREYLAVVAKTTDLTGSVSSSKGLREVLHQVQQCFDIPYTDLFGMKRVMIDRVWVVTSGRIVSGAESSIFESLQKQNLDRLIKFVAGERLVTLLDEKYPSFWNENLEPVDVLREQNSRLVRFCRELLTALGGSEVSVEQTLTQLIHSHFPPTVRIPSVRTLTSLSSYAVELDSIPEIYAHDFDLSSSDPVRDTFFRAKRELYYAMFDVEEIVTKYEAVIRESDPERFLNAFDEKLSSEYPFSPRPFGRAADAVRTMQYLEEGLHEFKEFMKALKDNDLWDWAVSLVDSVSATESDLKSFLSHLEQDHFTLFWEIRGPDTSQFIQMSYHEPPTGSAVVLKTSHSRSIEQFEPHGLMGGKTVLRQIGIRDITKAIQAEIRKHIEQRIGWTRKHN